MWKKASWKLPLMIEMLTTYVMKRVVKKTFWNTRIKIKNNYNFSYFDHHCATGINIPNYMHCVETLVRIMYIVIVTKWVCEIIFGLVSSVIEILFWQLFHWSDQWAHDSGLDEWPEMTYHAHCSESFQKLEKLVFKTFICPFILFFPCVTENKDNEIYNCLN